MTAPPEKLRVAILGAGMIGEIHRRASLMAGRELVGVMASTLDRSRQVAAKWGAEPIARVEQLADLAADIVHVCSPNALHEEHVEGAITAGANVICEKPLATSIQTAQRLVDLATSRGVHTAVPYVYRFHPMVREIQARASSGEFGAWQLLHGSYLQDWMLSPSASSWRVDAKAGGPSRAFADIGSHWCDLMEFVTGERIASLLAATTITVPQRPITGATFGASSAGGALQAVTTEDAASVLFRTRSGVLGSVTVSQVSAGRKNRLWFEFDGQKRSAVFDQENPETAWLGSEDSAEVLHRDPSRGSYDQRRLSTLPPGHPQGFAQCFENFVADTYATIKGEHRDGLPTFSDGLRSARIIDAVVRSAAGGRWVNVEQ
ncbi:Gfo/Idh/MocA family protein [Rhizobium sp. X9]|uniref:Gfo/Idh/MocA family protein n=1 Tax=Rhizobium sp. X9 TaxID=2815360 RepID=UPI00263B2CD1|nr:Gfo/Idh/MocA family oxidoreductase [Rhizobium sp. X9]